MTRRDETVRLRHMLDHAREAVALGRGRKRSDLDSDRVLNLALVRLLEIAGEAASRVSEEIRSRYPGIAGVRLQASEIGSFMVTIRWTWISSGKS